MKRQQRRRANGDGDLSEASGTKEERPDSAEQPVAQRQIGCPLPSTAQDDQLLLEYEILRDHRSHATSATQLRGHDGQVKQGEQDVLHARDSLEVRYRVPRNVAPTLNSARELAIRDPH